MGSNQSTEPAPPPSALSAPRPPTAPSASYGLVHKQAYEYFVNFDTRWKNLLRNPRAEEGLNFWRINENGSDGWTAREFQDFLYHCTHKVFESSYGTCLKSQLINLKDMGYSDEIMDALQPPIFIGDWYEGRGYKLLVQLLSRDKTPIQEFSAGYEGSGDSVHLMFMDCAYPFYQMTHTFCNYGRGVRYIFFQHGGYDMQTPAWLHGTDGTQLPAHWLQRGNCKVSYSSVMIELEDLETAHQRALQVLQSIDFSLIPEVVLQEILSWVGFKDLLHSCRLVCRQWRDFVDSRTLWKRKCQHAGYITKACRKHPKDWKIFYYLSTRKKNLIRNPSALENYKYWRIEDNGGDHWQVEHFSEDSVQRLEDQIVTRYFVTSYGRCTKSQLINLREMGYSDEIMDSYQPDIVIKDWYAARRDCGSRYELTVRLLSTNKTRIQEFCPEPIIIPQWSDARWHQMTYTFRNYGRGVRYIYFLHGGKDTQFWAGWYGIRVANSSIRIQPEDLDVQET